LTHSWAVDPDLGRVRKVGADLDERRAEALIPKVEVVAGHQQLADFLSERHSYDEPEIVTTPIVAGPPSYLSWIEEEPARSALGRYQFVT
jgi:hypothetical protein